MPRIMANGNRASLSMLCYTRCVELFLLFHFDSGLGDMFKQRASVSSYGYAIGAFVSSSP